MKKNLIYLTATVFLILIGYFITVTVLTDTVNSYKLVQVQKEMQAMQAKTLELSNNAETEIKDTEAQVKQLNNILEIKLKAIKELRQEVAAEQEKLFAEYTELNCKVYKECEKTQGGGDDVFRKSKAPTQTAPTSPSPYGSHQEAVKSYNEQVSNFKDQWDVPRDAW